MWKKLKESKVTEDFFLKKQKRSQTQEKKSQIFGEKPEDRRKFVHIDLGIDWDMRGGKRVWKEKVRLAYDSSYYICRLMAWRKLQVTTLLRLTLKLVEEKYLRFWGNQINVKRNQRPNNSWIVQNNGEKDMRERFSIQKHGVKLKSINNFLVCLFCE